MIGGGVAVQLGELAASKAMGSPDFVALLPEVDDSEARQGASLGDAEGQSFIIEYVDSKGRSSLRRVTVWSIEAGSGGMPCLYAKCHERQAMRQFRVDRIKSCADFDGEVYLDVMAFLAECFGNEIVAASSAASSPSRWSSILDMVRPDAVLLACVSYADGHAHVREAEEICDYLSFVAEAEIGMLTPVEISALERHVKRLRPSDAMISRALEEVSALDGRRKERLLRACVAVMDADGRRHQGERQAIQDLAYELTGASISI